jgi:hypothetical protein
MFKISIPRLRKILGAKYMSSEELADSVKKHCRLKSLSATIKNVVYKKLDDKRDRITINNLRE